MTRSTSSSRCVRLHPHPPPGAHADTAVGRQQYGVAKETDPRLKYNSNGAAVYREKIKAAAEGRAWSAPPVRAAWAGSRAVLVTRVLRRLRGVSSNRQAARLLRPSTPPPPPLSRAPGAGTTSRRSSSRVRVACLLRPPPPPPPLTPRPPPAQRRRMACGSRTRRRAWAAAATTRWSS